MSTKEIVLNESPTEEEIMSTIQDKNPLIDLLTDQVTFLRSFISQQSNSISQYVNIIAQQGNTIAQQGNTIVQLSNTISHLENTMSHLEGKSQMPSKFQQVERNNDKEGESFSAAALRIL